MAGYSHVKNPPESGGMIVALDPDIPEANQMISFLAQPREAVHEWRLNQQRLSALSHQPLWKHAAGQPPVVHLG